MLTYIHDVYVWYGDVPVRYVCSVRGNRLTASNLITPVQKSSTSATCHNILLVYVIYDRKISYPSCLELSQSI